MLGVLEIRKRSPSIRLIPLLLAKGALLANRPVYCLNLYSGHHVRRVISSRIDQGRTLIRLHAAAVGH